MDRKIFEPYYIDKIKLSNRIVALPFYTAYGSLGGHVTRAVLQHYEEIASSGVSMVITENFTVNKEQSHFGHILRADSDLFLSGLKDLAEIINKNGAVSCCQINHIGRFAQVAHPVSASPVPLISGGAVPHALTMEEIKEVCHDYAMAARRVKKAGFHMVEIHGASGYLPVQFLSPRTNKRNDDYGGSLEKRIRFFLELLTCIKEAVGDFPVGCRLMVDEWLQDGFIPEEAKVLARKLEEHGAAYLSVTAGTYESMFRKDMVEISQKEGYMLDLAQMIKQEVNIPVIACGRIASPELAERAIHEGKTDLIGLGRVILVDHLWVKKAQRGETIKRCKPNCDACLQMAMRQKPVICVSWDSKRKIKYKNMTKDIETPMIVLKDYIEMFKVKAAKKIFKRS